MKKILIILVLIGFTLTPFAQGLAEIQIPQGDSGLSVEDNEKLLRELRKAIKEEHNNKDKKIVAGVLDLIGKREKAADTETASAIGKVETAIVSMAGGINDLVTVTKAVDEKVVAVDSIVRKEAINLGTQNYENTKLIVILLILGFVLSGVLISALIWMRTKS